MYTLMFAGSLKMIFDMEDMIDYKCSEVQEAPMHPLRARKRQKQ